MRTENSIKNSFTSIICNVFSYIISFVAQALFIRFLGVEYLGLNGLFTNVLTMLSIFELGIGNAIVFNLYKPMADKDYKKVSALINFYKKAYTIIALVILVFGIILLPFIKFVISDITISINVYVVYFLFLLSTITSYFMAYKRSLIIASQHNYIINIIHLLYFVLLNILQLAILYFTKNYYLYLIIKIVCQIFESSIIYFITTKKYTYLFNYKNETLDKKTQDDILSRVKALFFHKVGGIVVQGTDNIIISKFLGIIIVGIYSNYYIVITAINMLFGQIISSSTASVGNLLVTENTEKKFDIFKKMRFLNFWISVFTSVSLLLLINPFISLWVGEKYLLNNIVVFVLVLNFFQNMQRNTYVTFKDSAGIWNEDRFVPLVEVSINIIFSILLLKYFGLAGVFAGTILSSFILWFYSYPKFVYKKLFERGYSCYFRETFGYTILFLMITAITCYISSLYVFENIAFKTLFNILICIIVSNAILIIIFRKTQNYNYFINLIKKLLKKIKKRNRIIIKV